ncbi:MAG: serine/threonine protein kinase [Candidatus Brocadia sp.]
MYSIDKYHFKEFKIAPGHRANYAILCNPEFKENQWGMKYSPANNYSREYKILSLFSHPQIPIRYAEGNAVMYKGGKSVLVQNYLIITHFEGEDVVEYYKKRGLPDQREIEHVIRYFSSATLPLQHMHSKGYIHSDIKPGHLILNPDAGTMALIDLECTIKMGEIICGMSKEYASPEQKQMIRLLRNGEDEKSVLKKIRMNAASDLYSVGLILYQVVTGKLWQEANIIPQEINKAIPDKLNKIILGLLEENPDNRIQSAEALRAGLEAV